VLALASRRRQSEEQRAGERSWLAADLASNVLDQDGKKSEPFGADAKGTHRIHPQQAGRGRHHASRPAQVRSTDPERRGTRLRGLRRYLTTYAEPNNKYSTVTSKKSIFKHHLLPAFGRFKLDEITLREIEDYKARKLATALSPKSINNHLTVLRKVLSVAVDWELLSHVPN
jgi:hypothetical protein